MSLMPMCRWTCVAALLGIPVIATVHGKNYFWEKLGRRLSYRWVSRRATMVAVSKDLKQFIVENVGISRDRVKVIHNGVDVLPHFDHHEVENCRRELGLPQHNQIVGVVGNLYPVKGNQYLIDGIPEVLQKSPHTSFVFQAGANLSLP